MPLTPEELADINAAKASRGLPPLKKRAGEYSFTEKVENVFLGLSFLLDLFNLPVLAVIVLVTNFFHPLGWALIGVAMILGVLAHLGLIEVELHVFLAFVIALWYVGTLLF